VKRRLKFALNSFISLLLGLSFKNLKQGRIDELNNFYKIINYAIKAPSGHNTQPWFFAIYENSIIITPNFERSLPAVDPNNRELFISLGCAVENLCIAANHYGYESQTDINSE